MKRTTPSGQIDERGRRTLNGRTRGDLEADRDAIPPRRRSGRLGDAELLGRFVSGHGEGSERAFEALVERHGPMVLAVCRRILRDPDAAQDAFQATFLVLARQAGRIGRRERLGGWLHGVASRTAMKARATTARRRHHERVRAESAVESASTIDDAFEIRAALHEEIARLPEKYRAPVVLCHLEGMTRERASAQLCCPEGTVAIRLSRARERLRAGLVRRGFAVAVGGLAVDLGAESASAALAQGVAESMARAASAFAVGRPVAGMVSSHVLNLTRGVLSQMRVTRWMMLAPAVLVVVGFAAGYVALAAQPAPAPTLPQQSVAQAKGGVARWRKVLPSGATVELIGVSPNQREPKTWWGPGGSPLAEPAFDRIDVEVDGRRGEKPRVFALKVTGVADPASVGVGWEFPDAMASSSSTPSWERGKPPAPGVFGAVASLPEGARLATFRVGLATGPWETKGMSTGAALTEIGDDAHAIVFTQARALKDKDGVALTVTDTYLGFNVRIVAIDRDGKEHGPGDRNQSVQGAPPFRVHDLTFSLPPDQLREVRFQARPYERVELRGVAIEPRKPSPRR